MKVFKDGYKDGYFPNYSDTSFPFEFTLEQKHDLPTVSNIKYHFLGLVKIKRLIQVQRDVFILFLEVWH